MNVAIVGATGAVGTTIAEILEQREFPVAELNLLASERSLGKRISFNNSYHSVKNLEEFDFVGTKICFFSAGGEISELYVRRAVAAGAIVIDNTSHYRRDLSIPLIVPEVNGARTQDGIQSRIIANPNCSTIQMVVVLKPIHDVVGVKRVNVSTYQAVSGAGNRAIKELAKQTANVLNVKEVEPEVAPVQIAFNAIPHIGDFEENGYTEEEMKMVRETKRIMEDENLTVNATCVRIPVFYGHSEAVHIETREKISAEDATELLRNAPGIEVIDEREAKGYPTALLDAANNDPVYVGRIREDISHPNGLSMWVVSDNVRKGAALNSVQIAEDLLRYLD